MSNDNVVSLGDPVDKPGHYNRNGVETWDIIEHMIADYPDPVCAYHVASMVKYLDRAPHKGDFYENVKKAVRHAQRLSVHLRSL